MKKNNEWNPPDFGSIPQEIRRLDAWVDWKAESNGDGKSRKVPYSPRTGSRVDVTDPSAGCSFEEAREAYLAGGYTGVGVVMDAAPGLVGIDLDKCVGPDGEIESWALEIVHTLFSYTECSPSGTGLHIFGFGVLPKGRRRKGNIEMYDGKRFLTVTGRFYVDEALEAPYPIRQCQKAIEEVHSRELGSDTKGSDSSQIELAALRGTSRRSDEEVLRLARKAKNGGKFSRLYDEGDWSGYKSQSEADLALCGILAFYTNRDPDQIERLFNASALCGEKWIGRLDYRERTIKMTIADFPPEVSFIAEGMVPAPDFPLDALPEPVAGFVGDNAERMGCPPELIAGPVLVALAGCIGREPRIAPKRNDTGWTERACLWAIVVAQKGSMKSPAQRTALGPLYRIQKERWECYQQEMSEWERVEAARKLRLKGRGKWADPKGDVEFYESEIETSKPVAVRPLVDDITVEAVVRLMPNNPRLTLVTDELSGFFKNMGRYNRGDDRGFWLQAHTASPTINDRKGSGTVFVEESYINIVGGIQPKVLRDVFFSREGADDGLLERFGLLVYPERSISRGEDRKSNPEIREGYYSVCEKLFETNWAEVLGIRGSGFVDGPCSPLRFAGDAQDDFDRWFSRHMEGLAEMADSPLIGFLSKSRGLLCRLALVLHLARWASGEESDPRRVSRRTLDGAIRLVDGYFTHMWRRAVLGGQTDWVVDLHGRIREHLRGKGGESFSRRDLARLNWRGLGDESAVDRFLNQMLSRGLAVEEQKPSGDKGGRPTTRYRLV